MSAIENEAWVEAVARAICDEEGGCVCLGTEMPCEDRLIQARAAIRALAPLIIERCTQEAACLITTINIDGSGHAARIRALIQKEASDAPAD